MLRISPRFAYEANPCGCSRFLQLYDPMRLQEVTQASKLEKQPSIDYKKTCIPKILSHWRRDGVKSTCSLAAPHLF